MGAGKGWSSKDLDEVYSKFEEKFKDIDGLKKWLKKDATPETQSFLITLIRFVENQCILKSYYEGMKDGMFTKKQLDELFKSFH